MFLNIPLAIWFGILTITSLFITAILGALTLKGKVKFKHHRFFAILTLTLALVHLVLAVLLWFFGIIL